MRTIKNQTAANAAVLELIYGDGTNEAHQRALDLANVAVGIHPGTSTPKAVADYAKIRVRNPRMVAAEILRRVKG